MRRVARYLWVVAAAAVLYVGWTLADRFIGVQRLDSAATLKQPLLPDHGGAVKILQFYSSAGVLAEGEKAILCYGVANAKAVRIEPAVAPVSLSPNRCFDIAPQRDTRYTLIAEGADGARASESFLVRVKPAAKPTTLPRIVYFEDQRKQSVSHAVGAVRAETVHSLCFSTENATQVAIEPPVFPPSGAFRGCFYVAPEKTTTYTLTATDGQGHTAQKQLTVEVR